jgi:uncharacterized protein
LNNLLIIFYKNPELGRVKTRLAKSVGDQRALSIYLKLSAHTKSISENLPLDKVVYYSHFVDAADSWPNSSFQKKVQLGSDLGEKMQNAFAEGFKRGYTSICIIGTDCFELTSKIIEQAFHQLEKHDAVIGLAKDGGYYLLGMKKPTPQLFQNKNWSTDSVASDTINDFKKLGLSFFKLPWLTDVDEESDLPVNW